MNRYVGAQYFIEALQNIPNGSKIVYPFIGKSNIEPLFQRHCDLLRTLTERMSSDQC